MINNYLTPTIFWYFAGFGSHFFTILIKISVLFFLVVKLARSLYQYSAPYVENRIVLTVHNPGWSPDSLPGTTPCAGTST
jgi:hypothetical protein